MRDEKSLTINKYDIVGNEMYKNLKELEKYTDLEELIKKISK